MYIIQRLISYLIVFFIIQSAAFAQDPFITTWKTDNPGDSGDNQITILTIGDGYNYSVDWGDGSSDDGVAGSITHTYSDPGTYAVSISGDFLGIYFGSSGDRNKIMSIEQWGDISWSSMAYAFVGCENLTVPANDAPDLSNVTDLRYMFANATSFNESIEHWDVSNVTDMSGMFAEASSFNQSLENWDVCNVTDMSGMFLNASLFNQPLENWDVSNVTNMEFMFAGDFSFNQPLNNWDVSNVRNMEIMFRGASSFNQPLENWDVCNVEIMEGMFNRATSFNQPLGNWDVSNVKNMESMFGYAASFNQPIDSWDVSSVKNINSMFVGATSFNQSIDSWDVSNVTEMVDVFRNAEAFNQPLNSWDVSNVTNMASTFSQARSFNQPLSNWDVSNVTAMDFMFSGAQTFDQNINSWDVSKVEDFLAMFDGAVVFNQPLDQWDVGSAVNMKQMFREASNFNQPIGSWDVSNVETMATMFSRDTLFNQPLGEWDLSSLKVASAMFSEAYAFNQPLENWDMSNVENIGGMFQSAYAFNQPLANWDVSNVKNMNFLFHLAKDFNQPIDSWDVGNTTGMFLMFGSAESFNQPLGNWDVSNVTRMDYMFYEAKNFNQPLEAWDVSSVTEMNYMFQGTEAFNQPLDGWDVSRVRGMNRMFFNTSAFNHPLDNWDIGRVEDMTLLFAESEFNQPLDKWDISSVTTLTQMLFNSKLSTENYDKTLKAWAQLNLQKDVSFHAFGLTYCSGFASRNYIIEEFGWSFISDQLECEVLDYDVLSARAASISFTLKGNTYIGLGEDSDSTYQDLFLLDPISEKLMRMDTFPGQPRADAVAFVINDKAYVGSGTDSLGNYLSDFYAYNPDLNEWEPISDLPGEARSSSVAFALDSAGYVGTGVSESGDLEDFWKYNPENDEWSEVTGFSGDARREAVAFVVDGKAYVSGGYQFDGFTLQLSDVQEYDPESGWTEKVFADTDLNFHSASAFVLFDRAFIAYGNQPYVVSYDPFTNETENLGDTLNLDDGEIGDTRSDGVGFVLGDTAYFGYGRSGFSITTFHNDLNQLYFQNVAPTDIQVSTTSFDENQTMLTDILKFIVTDQFDGGPHTYSLTTGDGTNDQDNSLFRIAHNTLQTNAEFNFETQNEFQFHVTVTDEAGEEFSKAFTITLNDLDEPPVFEETYFDILENSPLDTPVGTLPGYDPEGEEITYRITTKNMNTFRIEGDQIIVNDSLDYETSKYEIFTVEASDGTFTVSTTVIVRTLDVNEAPEIQTLAFEINENSPNETSIGVLTATDPEDHIFTFLLPEGDNTYGFGLRGDTLIVQDSSILDFESNQSITLAIEASEGSLSSIKDILINVQNINEAPALADTTFEFLEDIGANAVIGILNTVDPEGDALVYSIVEGNSDEVFAINATGELSSVVQNFEQDEYTLTVEVSDAEFTSEAKVNLFVVRITGTESRQQVIKVYPNPGKDLIKLTFPSDPSEWTITLIDVNGKTIKSEKGATSLDISALSPGMYFFNVTNGNITEQVTILKQ